MRVLINTKYDSAGSKICGDDLSIKFKNASFEVVRNSRDNYQNYDLILFMSSSHPEVAKVKQVNPKAVVGIMDPKIGERGRPGIKIADFLLVSSIEQRDFFLKHNKNIIIYYMFPETQEMIKEHTKKDKIIIGYHGNKVHLNASKEVSQALDQLSERYEIEFWAMYNINNLGEWKFNLPKKCPVKHIQWSQDNYYKYLSQVDIGIIPAFLPVNRKLGLFFTGKMINFWRNKFNLNNLDYLLRFKYSTNPGRIYPFSRLGIPVVADFAPSYCQLIQDGKSGFLVYSKEGWYDALEQLCLKPSLRQEMSDNLREYINNNCSPNINFNNLLKFIENVKKKKYDI